LTSSDQAELLADYLTYAQTVRVPEPPPKVPECRDLLDLPFLHLAVAGRAQVLVSGDRDLLSIASTFERLQGCPILSLDAFYSSHCVN
jgi:predicted nucleic acid-binding protein